MIFDWYNLFSLPEFLATGLVSQKVTVFLEGVGLSEILITRGNLVSIQYDDAFLPIEFEGDNPYVRDSYAVYKDANQDIWLGIEVPA